MLNLSSFFSENNFTFDLKLRMSKGNIVYTITPRESNRFGFYELKKIIAFINYLKKKKQPKLKIIVNMGNIVFVDKLTYILLECIASYAVNEGFNIFFNFSCKNNIWIEGIKYSPLMYLSTNNREEFNKHFKLDINGAHYRRLITVESNKNFDAASKLMQDIISFMKSIKVSDECRCTIAEVISELVDNALEHGESDCLVDLDITENYQKIPLPGEENEDSQEDYYGVNIVVVSFSKYLLNSKLKRKMESMEELTERYREIVKARETHSSKWNDDYGEEDFYNITAFQHKITGRPQEQKTGGTGLTKLLRTLELRSDAYNCYMITGEKAVIFLHDCIKYNEKDWVGFNTENNYFEHIPSKDSIMKNVFFLPGTGYNLNFVLRRENDE